MNNKLRGLDQQKYTINAEYEEMRQSLKSKLEKEIKPLAEIQKLFNIKSKKLQRPKNRCCGLISPSISSITTYNIKKKQLDEERYKIMANFSIIQDKYRILNNEIYNKMKNDQKLNEIINTKKITQQNINNISNNSTQVDLILEHGIIKLDNRKNKIKNRETLKKNNERTHINLTKTLNQINQNCTPVEFEAWTNKPDKEIVSAIGLGCIKENRNGPNQVIMDAIAVAAASERGTGTALVNAFVELAIEHQADFKFEDTPTSRIFHEKYWNKRGLDLKDNNDPTVTRKMKNHGDGYITFTYTIPCSRLRLLKE